MTHSATHVGTVVNFPTAALRLAPRPEEEVGWRALPPIPLGGAAPPRVTATRWQSMKDETRHVRVQTPDNFHFMCIGLRRMDIRLSVSGRTVHDGVLTPGMIQVTRPGVTAECVFRGAYDELHLHISNDLVAECASKAPERCNHLFMADDAPFRDQVIERLGLTLLTAGELGGTFGPIYADSLSIAIVSRLLASRAAVSAAERSSPSGLVRWRLKRALDYIEAHLGEPIGLAEIAAATGLTRMHFAAQFRAATGLRPHEYLLRRRVECAQQRLLSPNAAVIDVAVELGFQTQAHFTNVFKRFVGQPPHAWRQTRSRVA